jgi:uncharacterized protein (DUF1810 family)
MPLRVRCSNPHEKATIVPLLLDVGVRQAARLKMLPDHPTSSDDPYNLQRFITAQLDDYEDVCAELQAGRKTSHWMWFIFPQMKGLGMSATSDRFAISSLDEAQAYLQHPVLGQRLRECTQLVNLVEGRSLGEIFGSPDHLKFRSCMTLFAQATPENQVFLDALKKYCAGEFDPATLRLLENNRPSHPRP